MPSKDDKAGRKEEAILLLQKAANWLLGGGIIACSKRCQTQGVSQNGQEWQSHVSESEEARGKTPEGVTFKKSKTRAPLVVQWLRVLLLVQGTLEDPMCRRATKPVLRNSRACALEFSGVAAGVAATRPKCSRVHAPQQEKPPQRETHTPQLSNSPLAAIRESLHAPAETQHSPK